MSIYSTLWWTKIEIDDKWIEVTAQAVPSHIGEGYDVDPYPFLPVAMSDTPYRAVVIIQEGFKRKEGQEYINALLTLSGKEYQEIPFSVLLSKIRKNLQRRKYVVDC